MVIVICLSNKPQGMVLVVVRGISKYELFGDLSEVLMRYDVRWITKD